MKNSLDASLQKDGVFAFDMWQDLVTCNDLLYNTKCKHVKMKQGKKLLKLTISV
jgi:hypothetical protein